MSWTVWSKACVTGCVVAVALSTGACNRDESAEVDRDTDRLEATADTAGRTDTAGRKDAGHEGAPITLTGCLQRAGGINNYVLTQVNSPSDSPVATSGRSAGSDAVQREQIREARHAYALDGELDDAREMVGKQVRVTGTLAEMSDLRRGDAASDSSARRDRQDGLDIDAGDLPEVNVQQIVQVAENCGDARR